jgi:hypothetical protein
VKLSNESSPFICLPKGSLQFAIPITIKACTARRVRIGTDCARGLKIRIFADLLKDRTEPQHTRPIPISPHGRFDLKASIGVSALFLCCDIVVDSSVFYHTKVLYLFDDFDLWRIHDNNSSLQFRSPSPSRIQRRNFVSLFALGTAHCQYIQNLNRCHKSKKLLLLASDKIPQSLRRLHKSRPSCFPEVYARCWIMKWTR